MLYRILKITKTALKIIIKKYKKLNLVSFFVYFSFVKNGLYSDKMYSIYQKGVRKKALHYFDKLFGSLSELP